MEKCLISRFFLQNSTEMLKKHPSKNPLRGYNILVFHVSVFEVIQFGEAIFVGTLQFLRRKGMGVANRFDAFNEHLFSA